MKQSTPEDEKGVVVGWQDIPQNGFRTNQHDNLQ